MRLEFEKATDSIINNNILKELRGYENIIVFGAGDSGDWAVNLLRKNNIFPKCYCDNSSRKWGKSRNGLIIRSFEAAIGEYKEPAICIASMWREEIYRQICEYDGALSERTYDLLTSMAWETADRQYQSKEYEYIRAHEAEFEKLYEEFEDEQSKLTLEGILNYRLTRDDTWLHKIKSNETSYLDRTVIDEEHYKMVQHGSIIDGGAFDGDTVELFINKAGNGNVLEIHCYEAETKNIVVIEEKMAKGEWNPHRVFLHKAALWDKKEEIGFGGTGLSGHIKEANDMRVNAERIDDFAYQNVGLIKLDIEGAERKALLGAEGIIRKHRPILAICTYHLQDDILVLSDFIKSLNCNYKLVLRHYMLSAGDSILYGIPQ
ncbi:MAG: FkbM family methyltransferase [Lachnospiraceae bacterium]|nr:FkbM family methyltransferase [Lachnospiraceae bacterium]